jgi:hypothetical protein
VDVLSLGSLSETQARSAHTSSIMRAPADNALILVSVAVGATAGTPVEPTSVEGAGLSFSLITSSMTFDPVTVGSQLHNISIWRGMGTSLESSVITASFGITTTGCGILVAEVSGVSRRGNNGEAAVGKSIGTRSGTSNGQLVNGPSATSVANAWYGVWGRGTASAAGIVPNVNYTFIDRIGFSTPGTGLHSAWTTLSSGNTMQWKADVDGQNAAFLVELVGDNPQPSSGGQWAHGYGKGHRVFPPRVRNEFWVESGHQRSDDPATDTREG